MRDLGLRVASFLAFVALLAGSVWAAYAFLAVEGAEVRPLDDAFTVAAGRSFTVPYTLLNTGANEATLHVVVSDAAGAAFAAPSMPMTLDAFEEAPGWLTVAVPEGLPPGDRVLEVAVVDAEGARFGATTLSVSVVAPEGGAEIGEQVPVWYVGRFTDGEVFDTNVQAVAEGPWPKAQQFQLHPSWEPIVVTAGPLSQVVPGFARAVEGLHPGETVTVVLPPEDAYGPAWRNQTVPLEAEIERERAVPLADRSTQRATWERHIVSTGQGDPATYKVGDTFEIYQEPNTYHARIVAMDDLTLVYRFDLKVGEKYTFFAFWPEGSEVVSVNDTAAVLRTTPTTAPDERFTYFRPWENMTYVKSIDDAWIVLRHEVPAGFRYELPGGEGQPPTTLRVARVTDTEIVVETPNPQPLAGVTLVFDITRAS